MAPKREDVGAVVGGLAANLFRRHVADRAHDGARARSRRRRWAIGFRRRPRPSARARPKSRILTWPSVVTNRFSGFRSRWTMPLLVRGRETVRDLDRVVDGLLRRQRAGRQPRPQRLALEQLHDGIGRPVVPAEVVEIARMLGCESAATALASRSKRARRLGSVGRCGGEHLDRRRHGRAWCPAPGRPLPSRPRRSARGSRRGRGARPPRAS